MTDIRCADGTFAAAKAADAAQGYCWGYVDLTPTQSPVLRFLLPALRPRGPLPQSFVANFLPLKRHMFYCLERCWMSWNAAKRAVAAGYAAVAWYPEGTDGWQDAGLPLIEARPEARPAE